MSQAVWLSIGQNAGLLQEEHRLGRKAGGEQANERGRDCEQATLRDGDQTEIG